MPFLFTYVTTSDVLFMVYFTVKVKKSKVIPETSSAGP
jgi:hypothetical protein